MESKRPFSLHEWLAIPESVRKHIESQDQVILHLMHQVELLSKRIEELENRLNQNSQNSNKPPSSDGPFQQPRK
ncbi:MAG: DUF6444 domain-containing protein, partial [Desulfobacterales bacterium]|nr:DUF6444 domain-containing protein [Desulfobacterales bacterium]